LRVRLSLLPLLVPLADRPRRRSSKPARRVRLPQGTLGDRLMVGRQPLKLLMKVRPLLPEPREVGSSKHRFRGRLTGRTAGSEPVDVGSTPAPGTEVKAGLGRQPADHPCLNQGMLWVQPPPEPNLSSWSSLECSPPCQGGERGFESHRGRSTARYANGKAAKLKPW
jgi:hypothetical protein